MLQKMPNNYKAVYETKLSLSSTVKEAINDALIKEGRVALPMDSPLWIIKARGAYTDVTVCYKRERVL